jgi:hypothetical protein
VQVGFIVWMAHAVLLCLRRWVFGSPNKIS